MWNSVAMFSLWSNLGKYLGKLEFGSGWMGYRARGAGRRNTNCYNGWAMRLHFSLHLSGTYPTSCWKIIKLSWVFPPTDIHCLVDG